MEKIFVMLHVVASVFIVGPMVFLPMTVLRSIREKSVDQLNMTLRLTTVLTYLSAVVVVLGFGITGMSDGRYSMMTPWVLWSLMLWLVACGAALFLVVPGLREAIVNISGGVEVKTGKISAGVMSCSVLLLVVVVLMVWRP